MKSPTLSACRRSLLLMVSFAWATSAWAGVTFETLPAGGDVIGMGQPSSISSDGSTIVGSSWSIAKWEGQSFRWTPSGGVEILESAALPLASKAGGTSSTSATPVVAGQRFSDYPQAYCWSGGVLKNMVASRSSAVNDVSKDGKTLVGSNPVVNTVAPVATKWTVATAVGAQTTAAALGDATTRGAESEAKRISGNGTTIVGWRTAASGVEAFRLVGTGAITGLGDLTGGKFFSEANAVSTDGLVVVGRSHSTKGPEAFRWTSTGGMVALGELPGGAVYSEATGVSGDGTIVVGTSSSVLETDIFVWTATAGMRSLAALCRAAHVDLNGWRFPYSRPVISEDGNSLTGDAISPQIDQVVWKLTGVRELVAQTPTLFWQGGTNSTWDTAATNWTDGSAPTAFANAKKVTFDDFGTNTSIIAVAGTLAPSAVLVDASVDYTFGGSGSLTGTMSLLKTGTGTLTMAGAYQFSGGTTVQTGTLALSGTLEDTGTLGVVVMPGATLQLLGGTIRGKVRVMAGGFLTGTGTIIGNVTNEGTVTTATGGTLTLNGATLNQGTMRLTGGTALALAGSFVNNGVVDVITGSISLPPTFSNNGVLLDSSSVRIESLAKTGTTVQLSVRSAVGHAYRMERNATLSSGSWTPVGADREGDGSVLSFTDPGGASGPCGFYRIMVVR